MRISTPIIVVVALAFAAGGASAQIVLIDPTTRNGGFEDLPEGVTDTLTMDDATPDDGVGTEVPFWQDEAGPYSDSGVTGVVRDGGQVYTGTYAGKAQANAYAYNQTDYVLQEGDVISLTWEVTSFYGADGTPSVDHYVGLYGTATDYASRNILAEALNVNVVNGSYSPGVLNYTAVAADAGLTLGLRFGNRDGFGWIGFDDFVLTVTPASDADGDGLVDSWEIANFRETEEETDQEILDKYGASDDPDDDGSSNFDEYEGGSDPKVNASVPGDVDGDTLPDADETTYFGNLDQGADDDFDHDYATNSVELLGGTSPTDASDWPDEDFDDMNDAWEEAFGLDTSSDDSDDDHDGDNSSNIEEFLAGSDPDDSDWTATHASLRNRWSFNGNLEDSVDSYDADIIDPDDNPDTGGGATLGANSVTLAGGARGTSSYISLGPELLSYLQNPNPIPVTIELWATQHAVQNWSRIFAIGNDTGGAAPTDGSLAMTWTVGNDLENDRVLWAGRSESDGTSGPYVLDVSYHMVMSIVPAVFTDGLLTSGAEVTWYASPASGSIPQGHPLFDFKGSFIVDGADLIDLVDNAAYLGRSMWNGDNTASASYDEFRIWAGTLTETERELFHLVGPDNIDRSDSEPDGFPDAWEMARFGNLSTATMGADSDGDGDDDEEEFAEESNPNDAASTILDVDGDGLDDYDLELLYFNNLLRDGTGDYDGDRISDLVEYDNYSDPTDPDSSPDLDDDLLPDGWEYANFGDPALYNDMDDPDGDGDDNYTEYSYFTDPNDEFSGTDSEPDGMPDFWEITFLGSSDALPGDDPDGDSFTNVQEFEARSNPTVAASVPGDVNGDGVLDVLVDYPEIVAADDFDSYEDTTFVLYSDGADTVTLVDDGNGGNAVNYTTTLGGGFFAGGFQWNPVIQPGANGPNRSTNYEDYYIVFDLTVDSAYVPAGGVEVWLRNQATEALPAAQRSALLFVTNQITSGVKQTVIFSMADFVNAAPFGYELGGFVPTFEEFQIRVNGLDGAGPEATELSITIDNFMIRTIESVGGGDGAYATWASSKGLTVGVNDNSEDNPENDRYSNVLEYQLNGDPLAYDSALMSYSSDDETYFSVTFQRYDESETDSTLSIGWGSNLTDWTMIPIGAASANADGNGVIVNVTEDGGVTVDYDLIEVLIPKANAVGGKLFVYAVGTQP